MSSRFWLAVAFVIAFGAPPANPRAAFGGKAVGAMHSADWRPGALR
ncbi:MAG: hypothetical protein JO288_04160 [Hyphomicrobiales bacterium]|nr:hypothetical protein [Hyphomicrobiales bacterium]